MKKIFLFSTKFTYYWVLLPLIALLTLCIVLNDSIEHYLKLYPLIAVTVIAILFTLVYYFRGVLISYAEIREVGRFSSRDTAIINKGKTIILYSEGHSCVRVTLFGNDGVKPELSWMKSTQDAPHDISLFRSRAFGGRRTIKRVLKYFGVPEGELDTYFDTDCERKYTNVTVSSKLDGEIRKIYIKMDKTV